MRWREGRRWKRAEGRFVRGSERGKRVLTVEIGVQGQGDVTEG